MGIFSGAGKRRPLSLQTLFAFLSLFAALCTIFALAVSAAQAWSEHRHLSWPSAVASIRRCAVDTYRPTHSGGRSLVSRIACDIRYSVGDSDVQARIRSSSSSSDIDVSLMRRWIAGHRPGASVEIHYDPSNPSAAVLTQTDMPFAGPHTPNNLKILAMAAVAFVVFYSLARILARSQRGVAAAP